MTVQLNSATFWDDLVLFFEQELSEASEDERQSILYSLYRVLEKQDDLTAAFSRLEEAKQIAPISADILWDVWRSACRQDTSAQKAALKALSAIKDPHQAAACLVRLSRLVVDEERDTCLSEANSKAPDSKEVLWALLEQALSNNEITLAKAKLNTLSKNTSDPVWRAILLLEIAQIEHKTDNNEQASSALNLALEHQDLDWTIINDIYRLSAQIEDWSVHEKALQRMAIDAREEEAQVGFWWMLSVVRQGRLNDYDGAIDAIEKAIELLPDNQFLSMERTRLLQMAGRFDVALESIPAAAMDSWKAELALLAKRPELLQSLLFSDTGSVIKDALLELTTDNDEPTNSDDTLAQWLEKHPGHPHALNVASKIVANDEIETSPIAKLTIEENTSSSGPWPPITTTSEEAWYVALLSVAHDITSTERAERLLKWADTVEDPELKGILHSMSARLLEDSSPDKALELYKQAVDLVPSLPTSGLAVARTLRKLKRWDDLSTHLADTASATHNAETAQASLHEQAIVCDYALDDKVEAASILDELIATNPVDTAAIWSSVRLAIAQSDWATVVERLEQLVAACPEDADWLNLLCAEINFFLMGNDGDALSQFEQAAGSNDKTTAKAARLYRLIALHRQNDAKHLYQALQEEGLISSDGPADFLLPELLETGRVVDGISNVAQILEDEDEPSTLRLLWQLLIPSAAKEENLLADSLQRLAKISPPGAMAGACRTASRLINPVNSAFSDVHETDFESEEALWQTADRLDSTTHPRLRADIFRQRATMTEAFDEFEWIDWSLDQAEALEEAGELKQALAIVNEALNKSPEHPGLLQSRARIAAAAGLFAEAADTHGRLAKFFAVDEEKSNQLAAAAAILFEKMNDDLGAENICKETLRREPGHTRAHEISVDILKSRGDEAGVARLIEQRIGVKNDSQELIRLYQEQADQQFALDDMDGALLAIDNLLMVDPKRLEAHLMKIDMLANLDQWENVIVAMDKYLTCLDDPVEIRNTTWRAAKIITDRIGETNTAISWLIRLVDSGDRHPDTQRRICDLCKKSGQWDQAADGLKRLVTLIEDPEQKAKVILQEAKVRLNQLFDDEAAAQLVDTILESNHASLETLEFASTFFQPDKLESALSRAALAIGAIHKDNPIDLKQVAELREVAKLASNQDLVEVCNDTISILSGGSSNHSIAMPAFSTEHYNTSLRSLLLQSDDTGPATVISKITAGIYDTNGGQKYCAQIGRKTLVQTKSNDPLRQTLEQFARLLGINEFELHRLDGTFGSVALSTETPSIAVDNNFSIPLSATEGFFLAQNLWRSYQGLGAFTVEENSGPVRWIMAVTAAVLGDVNLPLSTDRDLVTTAKKVIPRRMRKMLTEPCEQILKQDGATIRAWANGATFSADRVGLLFCADLPQVIKIIAEDSAGEAGLKRFAEDPARAISLIPRCRELMKFALSEGHLEARNLAYKTTPKGDK